MRAAADVADHWVQSEHQAGNKHWRDSDAGHTSAEGRKACAAHVASYVGTQAVALVVGSKVLGVNLSARSLVTALTISGVTHYVADRRFPLVKVADIARKQVFVRVTENGMNGRYCLDQAWHHAFETVAAVASTY
jgi:hypothetical protein